MAREVRVEYPGAIHHAINRGDRREEIFQDAANRQLFLASLGEACAKTAWQVHAWCLMPNHFHLFVETPRGNLVAGMKWAETEREQAEGRVQEGLQRLGWTREDLETRPKGHQEKVKLALRLRAEKTRTVQWIAERLQMGTWTHVNHLLYWHRHRN